MVSATPRTVTSRLSFGEELEDRIELGELGSGDRVEPFLGDHGEGLFHDPVGPGIPVVIGMAKHLALRIDEHIVDPPGVGCDAVKVRPERLLRPGEAFHDLAGYGQDVPVKARVTLHGVRREPVHLRQCDFSLVQRRNDATSALGPEVETDESPGVGHACGVVVRKGLRLFPAFQECADFLCDHVFFVGGNDGDCDG